MMLRALGLLLLFAAAPLDQRRHGPDSPDRGLPRELVALAPYHADPEHVLNRIFRTAWLARLAPAEVAAVLPREGALEWSEGWVHRKRAGKASDERWFGGDGRQLPREQFDAAGEAQLLADLAALDAQALAPLRERADLAVLFQHDLLRVALRLEDSGANPALIAAALRAAQAVALPAAELDKLTSTLSGVDLGVEVSAALAPAEASPYREILRRSTRLFDAEHTLLWSRVWLAHPGGVEELAKLLPAARGELGAPHVPLGTRAVLLQGIVALDANGRARATPLVVDVRTQALVNRAPLAADNPTFTRDGIDFEVRLLEREGVRSGAPAQRFRRVDADDQELFRDYGTLKHTTYRAQCALCHRNTDTPEPELGGFPILRPHARAEFALSGEERLRLAEAQAQRFFDALVERR